VTIDPLKTIFTTDARLDDMARARIWTELAPHLASAPPQRRRWPVVACAGVAAVAALAVFLLARRDGSVEHVVPRGGVLALPLGPATRAVVEGPGSIRVEREGEQTAVELRGGTLYGEFTGGGGRSLRIEAAGATIEIVGTVFTVSVVDGTACLAVAHGRVRMTSAAVAVEVDGGQRACAVRGAPPGAVTPIDAATRMAVEHYQRTWLADAAAASPTDVTAAARADVTVAAPAEVTAPAPADVTAAAPADAAVVAPADAAVVAPAVSVEAPPAPHVHSIAPQVAAPAPAPPESVTGASSADLAPAPAPQPGEDAVDAGSTVIAAAPPPSRVDAAQPASPAQADKDLYKAADDAIARGEPAVANRALADLLARAPHSPLADEARYERARLAFDRHDWSVVRELVAAVQPSSPLREPAAYLGCRAVLETGIVEGRACLSDYVTAFPKAPHAVDARVQIIEIAYRMGGCDAIAQPLAELRAAAPGASALATWHRRCGSP